MRTGLLIVIVTIILLLTGVSVVMSQEEYVYIRELEKVSVPAPVYYIEKDLDLFENAQCPPGSFEVYPYDLNKDGQMEYFVSNPDNNGLYAWYWRIYEQENKKFKPIAYLFCTSLRLPESYKEGYQDVECYSYITLAEGNILTYQHFGDQYHMQEKRRVNSYEYFIDNRK